MDSIYKERFLRCLGILNERQLARIRQTTLAVGGLGLGGSVFLNLVRMGFEKFHIADPDTFERTNVNRQRGARETTVGRRKDRTLADEALAINPDVRIKIFPEGVQDSNIFDFLDGVDWAVDIIDVFALPQKIKFHQEARRRGIPVVSCAAVGFAGVVAVFDEGTPSFEELTGMDPDAEPLENLERFFRFICPEIPEYMREQTLRALNRETYIPFVVPGVEISAAFATAELVKGLLGWP
ncbi:MAG TPA: ThiF family adenylyltransferase, partial [Pseudobdellovibrionaceae bacterium]|nr:ThiF family adenylyltransferase [Pseudobdellovibrionaceae bacterium]